MSSEDIPQVANIERLCFNMPWPTSAYRRELKTPETNRYIVARFIPPEDTRKRGLLIPTPSNLTVLSHPEMRPVNGHAQPTEQPHRSLLESFLPWLRKEEHASETESGSSYGLAGYAGLWLMVDEAHVT